MLDLNRLPNQDHDEKTVLFLRRHWIQLLSLAGYGISLFALPVFGAIILPIVGFDFEHPIIKPIMLVLLSCYLLFVLVILLTQFTDYYLDTWIVTSERIISIEQKGLFVRTIATLHLNQIQDVTAETEGFLGTFLTYGNVYIQTAGTRERFNFKTIDNPETVKNTIMHLVESDKNRHGDASKM